MRSDDLAELVRKRPVPWDDLRAARTQRRVLRAVRGSLAMGPQAAPDPRATERAFDPKAARASSGTARSRVRPLAWAFAAAALIAALVLLVSRSSRGPAPARLDFADGSFVMLEASARVVPDVITPDRIELRQSAGTASYDVAPRSNRKFVVWTEDVRVEVLGTAFRIERLDAAVHVVVQRGHVQVTRGSRTVSLVAGEEVTLSDTDPPSAEPRATSAVTQPPPGPTSAADSPAADSPTAGSPTADSPAPPDASGSPSAAATVAQATSAAATATLEQPPSAGTTTPEEPGPAELFRRADAARASGNTAEALRWLNQLLQRHPKDGRRSLAVFTIGRLEAQRGNHARAAAAFESLGSGFGGEALAEAALAHAAAGQSARARALATQYTSQFPAGPRLKELSRLVE